MSKVTDLHIQCSRDPEYRAAYEALAPNFELARSLIQARTAAGLTQAQLAERMKTSQSVIARIEGGRAHPATKLLDKFARSTGARLRITCDQ